ncbi:MAG: extensin, partial [Pseudomonadota bacterium]
MTRGVSWFVVGSLVLVALAGCGRGFMTAEREPWRAEAEKACLKSGAVKETADLVRIDPISGPGACGAEFPLKVAALGEPMSSLGYADDLRPPGSIGNQPRWPASQPQSPSYQPSYSSSQPPSYPSSSYP